MKFSAALGLLASTATELDRGLVCTSFRCPAGYMVGQDGLCHTCDTLTVSAEGLQCTFGENTLQFEKRYLPSCTDMKTPEELLQDFPAACRTFFRCPPRVNSKALNLNGACYNCEQLENVSNGQFKCTRNGQSFIFHPQLLPICSSEKIEFPELSWGGATTCRPSTTKCPYGKFSTMIDFIPVCHTCDEKLEKKDTSKLSCTSASGSISVETSLIPYCSTSNDTSSTDLDQPVLCTSVGSCPTRSNSMFITVEFGKRKPLCQNCDEVTVNGKTVNCKRGSQEISTQVGALPSCKLGSQPPFPRLPNGRPTVCKSRSCPAGIGSIKTGSGSEVVCHNCKSLVAGSEGEDFVCTSHDDRTFPYLLQSIPSCKSPPESPTLDQPHPVCKSRFECPVNASSVRSGSTSVCFTCESHELSQSSFSCSNNGSPFSIDVADIQNCYESTPLPALANAAEGGACLGDYSCPAGTTLAQLENHTVCHNCEAFSSSGAEGTDSWWMNCTHSSGLKSFQRLSRCSNVEEPFESLSIKAEPNVCTQLFSRGCPLLSSFLHVNDVYHVCHNCEVISILSGGTYSCVQGGKTKEFQSTVLCHNRIITSSPTPPPNEGRTAPPNEGGISLPNEGGTAPPSPLSTSKPSTSLASNSSAGGSLLAVTMVFLFYWNQ